MLSTDPSFILSADELRFCMLSDFPQKMRGILWLRFLAKKSKELDTCGFLKLSVKVLIDWGTTDALGNQARLIWLHPSWESWLTVGNRSGHAMRYQSISLTTTYLSSALAILFCYFLTHLVPVLTFSAAIFLTESKEGEKNETQWTDFFPPTMGWRTEGGEGKMVDKGWPSWPTPPSRRCICRLFTKKGPIFGLSRHYYTSSGPEIYLSYKQSNNVSRILEWLNGKSVSISYFQSKRG